MKEIKELTGIRFFAALHVVFFHNFFLAGDLKNNSPAWLLSMISFGDCAVSFFFILSGFILTYVYMDNASTAGPNPKKFWWARFSRIYPIYLLAFMIDLPRGLSYFFNNYSYEVAMEKVLISALAHLSMLQSWHPRLTPVWNSPAWSLSTEMFFYFIFPLVVPLVFKIKKNLCWMLLLYFFPIITFVTLNQLTNIDFDSGEASTFWRSFPLLRSSEFLLGVFTGKIFLQRGVVVRLMGENVEKSGRVFWCSLILSLILISLDPFYPRAIFSSTFLVPLFIMMILILASIRVPYTNFLRSGWIFLLGGSSYALYMIHVPILYFITETKLNYGGLYMASYIGGTLILSILLFRKLEIPVQKLLRQFHR